jgi:hypothetical protein
MGSFKKRGELQKICSASREARAIADVPRGDGTGCPQRHGRPTSGRSNSVMLTSSAQKLLDSMKSRKFSIPRSFF